MRCPQCLFHEAFVDICPGEGKGFWFFECKLTIGDHYHYRCNRCKWQWTGQVIASAHPS